MPRSSPRLNRRSFLAGGVGLGGALLAGVALDRVRHASSDATPEDSIQAMATELGSDYLELVRRGHLAGRSAELQLVLQPYSSSNYAFESRSLVPGDPRTSHAAPWLYLERVPIAVFAPGVVDAGVRDERVSLADLAPTTAGLLGVDFSAPDGEPLPGIDKPAVRPKVVVTFVIDGGGWNVLQHWTGQGANDPWPNLRRLFGRSLVYRNAITGSFPAVTACAHATIGTGGFPSAHGITGHYLRRDGHRTTAYGKPGEADPTFLLRPTLADVWSHETNGRAWIGEIGYQIWHLGMIGAGGERRAGLPVGAYFDEANQVWAPQNPDLYRVPNGTPTAASLTALRAAYVDPGIDAQFDPTGSAVACCSPPIIHHEGALIRAAFDHEPVGQTDATSLLYINFKAPDYTGHVYGMASEREAIALAAVDQELGALVQLLESTFRPGEFVLFVTADHGQCPPVDASGGVRLDPIQFGADIEALHGGKGTTVVESVVPSEVYLSEIAMAEVGTSPRRIAAALRDYRYRDSIGPYVKHAAISEDRLSQRVFAALLPGSFIDELTGVDLSPYGEGAFSDADPNGLPPRIW
ncbi:MAG: hypothetical protein QOI60_118 [Actinomycetota bacterium]|nr:hypothetical protein [Actinomycetota bacterium]